MLNIFNGQATIISVNHYRVMAPIDGQTWSSGLIAKSNGQANAASDNHYREVTMVKLKYMAWESNQIVGHPLLVSTIAEK